MVYCVCIFFIFSNFMWISAFEMGLVHFLFSADSVIDVFCYSEFLEQSFPFSTGKFKRCMFIHYF